jgi:glyoxylase-like metal-dependent hydrolase (beta-lactamase superfamily II)
VPELANFDIALVRAPNPGPMTLSGTNTWIVGRDPAWVVDPGPAIPEHLDAVAAQVTARGGAAGIAVTHDHADHAEGAEPLMARLGDGIRLVAGHDFVAGGDRRVAGGDMVGPFRVFAVPGHSDDHVVFVAGAVAFTGDAVLGEGSVFVRGRLAAYLDGLARLKQLGLALICPGHGPPVWDPAAKLDGYIGHRLDRERRLLEALERGLRTEDELIDAVWSDAPAALRPAALLTLRAHLEKLDAEGRNRSA